MRVPRGALREPLSDGAPIDVGGPQQVRRLKEPGADRGELLAKPAASRAMVQVLRDSL
jgi:hypothetical protein